MIYFDYEIMIGCSSITAAAKVGNVALAVVNIINSFVITITIITQHLQQV